MAGVVKFFNIRRGFGYIHSTSDNDDLYVRYTAVQQEGFKALYKSQTVTFTRGTDDAGRPIALNVIPGPKPEKAAKDTKADSANAPPTTATTTASVSKSTADKPRKARAGGARKGAEKASGGNEGLDEKGAEEKRTKEKSRDKGKRDGGAVNRTRSRRGERNTSKGMSVTSAIHRGASLFSKLIAYSSAATGDVCYTTLESRVARLAAGLIKSGVKRDSRVALLAFNSHAYLEVYYAVPWAGAIVVPLNIRLALPEIIDNLLDCTAECLIVDGTFAKMLPGLKPSLPDLRVIINIDEPPSDSNEDVLSYEGLIASNSPMQDTRRGGEDIYGIFYTGGTTAKSKGVMLTHTNIVSNAQGILSRLQYTSTERYLHCAPMFHLADSSQTFAVTIAGGAHLFIPKFVPSDFIQAVATLKPKSTVMVPVMISAIIHSPETASADLSSLTHILYGASPMTEALLLGAMKAFPKAKWTQGYGMTECSPIITLNTDEFHKPGNPKLLSVGQPVCWVEVKILDEHGNEVPRGTVGEVCSRGPHVMKGYWNKPELTESAIKKGFMHTGDGGYMDEDGFIFLVDRLKDMIISGGENVYSSEVENVIMGFSSVQMCAVVGSPDDTFGEIVTAVVVPKAGATVNEAELIAHCKAQIAGFKCPKKVVVKSELPISGAGKILKHVIRKEFWGEGQRIYGGDNVQTSYK